MSRAATAQQARERGDAVALGCLLLVTAFVLGKDISLGGFRHGDSSAHAMDGVLIHDWVAAGFRAWLHPMEFAAQQYAHYPTLGMGQHYPPGFAIAEAWFFAVFGISPFSARLCVVFFGLVAAAGAYVYMRSFSDRWASALGTVALITMPVTTTWGRQVMLEVPTLAVLIWAGVAFSRYLREPAWRRLFLVWAAALSAVLFKQPAVFLMGALAATMVTGALLRSVRWSHAGCTAALTIAGGVVVLASLDGHAQRLLRGVCTFPDRWSWPALSFYLRQVPRQVGAACLVGVSLFVVTPAWTALARGRGFSIAGWNPERRVRCADRHPFPNGPRSGPYCLNGVFLGSWFVACYGMLVVADYKNPRFLFLGLFPFAVAAGLGAGAALRRLPGSRVRIAALLLASAACFAAALRSPVEPYPDYGPAVLAHKDRIAGRAVLFSGLRDGDFVFAVRATLPWRRAVVIRGSKLLYTCNGRVDLDFKSNIASEAALTELMRRFAFRSVFVERENKLGLKEDRMLRVYLSSGGDYRRVSSLRFQMGSSLSRRDTTLDVYEAVVDRPRRVADMDLVIPRAHRTIHLDLRPWS